MFKNADQTLRWAYQTMAEGIVKISSVNDMREGHRGEINYLLLGLSPYEIHGQAAAIVGMVEKLPDPAEREFIEAKFGRKLSRDDLEIVVYRGCAAVGFGLDKTDAVYKIVRGYFDNSMSHRATRRVLSCRDQYAVMVRRCLYDTLDLIHDHALADMARVLEDHGLIRSRHLEHFHSK